MRYTSDAGTAGGSPERIGILLVNSGTPEAATPAAVRAFLARFLSDPRVIELPRALWLPLLWGAILPLRPRRVARKYQKIWTASGSPLRQLSEQLRQELTGVLAQRILAPLTVEVGMLYSPPDVQQALERLRAGGAQRILVLPLFPQYCAATTGAAFDQVSAQLRHWRALPELAFVADYHDHPGYIEALRASVAAHWDRHGRTAHLLMSFHGIPEDYARRGDPYQRQCQRSARLLADELLLREGEWSVSFQSRFGPREWLRPYTATVLAGMPARGVREVSLVCPGFAVDCLETLEEIAVENRALFLRAGGERYEYVPALNASAGHARCLADLIGARCQGWTQGASVAAAHGAPA
ncbi:MAG TPA: ferrochelatase [Steroidobacteraceae bacterium]|jgi:ferrochelatase